MFKLSPSVHFQISHYSLQIGPFLMPQLNYINIHIGCFFKSCIEVSVELSIVNELLVLKILIFQISGKHKQHKKWG
jgi:hypothetical protein